MDWVKWLKERMGSSFRDEAPEELLLMDEMYAMIEVAGIAKVELPAMKRKLEQLKLAVYHKNNGAASVSPDEMIMRAMCIASVEFLIGLDADTDTNAKKARARKTVAEISGRTEVKDWHKKHTGREFTNGFVMRQPDQVRIFQEILRRKHNEAAPDMAVKDLFSQ